jgi:phage baseplate assembly protein W
MVRHDYALPFRIDGASRQAQRAVYAAHVRQMIRQVLLTSPGERVNLPEFGCGLRQLLFAPLQEGLDASVKIAVLQALQKWLALHIEVKDVRTSQATELGELHLEIEYVLRETRSQEQMELLVR